MNGLILHRSNEKLISVFIVLLFVILPFSASSTDAASSFILKASSMLDVRNAKIVSPATLIIRNGIIDAINPATIPKNLKVIDLGDQILLPGLIDMHTHITSDYFTGDDWTIAIAKQTTADWALQGVKFSRDVLNAGFTTIRDLGAQPGFPDVALMRAIDAGFVEGPDIWPAGHAISITGGHCDWTGYAPGIISLGPEGGIADGVAEAIKAVRYQAKFGVRVIKVCATGGVYSFSQNAEVGAQQYSIEELEVIVREAHKLGLKVAAHAHGTIGINAAVMAGVDSIEHGSILTEESVELMKANGTFLVPQTYLNEFELPPETPAETVAKNNYLKPLVVASLKLAYKSGVKMAFGSDNGVFPHNNTALEFNALVRNGISEADALRMATIFAAQLLGVEDRGELAQGKRADIIAVSTNPLEDIRVMEAVTFVMKEGVIYKN
ncbi:metal-dependent hydrolase family protein [Aliiglaciecola lipolytica]|uniref:Amidohydrolase n=1 Tax=Aliiglaciecola lipolytica E3 TaxID=1127673 RepID=K6Y9Z4_9ALTE|nr:amidohydrolase family protein [Aliiglaciecola lipolytica]GAC13473.1 amidohydrolase [Aliiglaciecola lipolytica E3]